jgi:c-di-AMP phosphodiesterase-like protein
LKIKRRFNNQPVSRETKVVLKKEQVDSAVNNLINLINTEESKDYFIPKENIFELLEHKYKISPLCSHNPLKHKRYVL